MNEYTPRQWAPDERPTLPGGPSFPKHSNPRRVAFFLVGTLVTLTGGLGNALVTVNLINLQGALGAYAAETNWLPAAYVMGNAGMNLLLVKFRQQYGLRAFTEFFLMLYALVTFAHLFVNDLGSAIAVRVAHGMAGAALSTLGLYYTLQAFRKEWRLKGVVISIGVSQLAAADRLHLFQESAADRRMARPVRVRAGPDPGDAGRGAVAQAAARATASRPSVRPTSSPSPCSRPAWRCCARR
jgi:hypothetical protein